VPATLAGVGTLYGIEHEIRAVAIRNEL